MTILNDVLPGTKPEGTPNDEPSSYLETFVGEGKKYKTPEDLAKAKAHADKHIETILAEKRELEAKFGALQEHQKTIHEIMEELKKGNQAGVQNIQQSPQSTPQTTTEDISTIVAKQIAEREALAARERLKEKLKADLTTSFGDFAVASDAIKKYVGNDQDKLVAIDKLLTTDFESAVKIIKEKSGVDGATFSDSNNTKKVTMPSGSAGLTWSKCEEIRKKDPKLYKSLNFQNLMHSAAQANPNFMKQ
jgi:hypothetical protein